MVEKKDVYVASVAFRDDEDAGWRGAVKYATPLMTAGRDELSKLQEQCSALFALRSLHLALLLISFSPYFYSVYSIYLFI